MKNTASPKRFLQFRKCLFFPRCFMVLLLLFLSVSLCACPENTAPGEEKHSISEGLHWQVPTDEESKKILCSPGGWYEPFHGAYCFNKNYFDLDEVNGLVFFGMAEEELHNWYEHANAYKPYYGDITKFHILVYVGNDEISRNYDLCLSADECGVGYTAGGIFVISNKTFASPDEVPYDNYFFTTLQDGNCYFRHFAYMQQVTVPRELFVGEEGDIRFSMLGCVHYANGEKQFIANEGLAFHYKIEGDSIAIAEENF